jgi:hypothetical protein
LQEVCAAQLSFRLRPDGRRNSFAFSCFSLIREEQWQPKNSGRKYGKAAAKSVKSAMHRKKKGTLKSGKGGKGGTVKSRKQAIAIGLSETREKAPRSLRRNKQL